MSSQERRQVAVDDNSHALVLLRLATAAAAGPPGLLATSWAWSHALASSGGGSAVAAAVKWRCHHPAVTAGCSCTPSTVGAASEAEPASRGCSRSAITPAGRTKVRGLRTFRHAQTLAPRPFACAKR